MDYHLHESFPEDWEADALLDCTPSTSGFRDDNATWVDTGTQKEGKRSSDSIWIIAVALLAINLVFVFSIYMELTRGPDPKSPAPLVYCMSLDVTEEIASTSIMLTSNQPSPCQRSCQTGGRAFSGRARRGERIQRSPQHGDGSSVV